MWRCLRCLYNLLWMGIFIGSLPVLPILMGISKKKRANLLHRLGFIHLVSAKKRDIYRIWVHALSVGEAKSAIPLIRKLHEKSKEKRGMGGQSADIDPRRFEIVMTVSTKTGYDVVTESLGHDREMNIEMGYFPFDFFFSVRRICRRIDPDMMIIVESDLWPELLWYLSDKNIPLFLVNARLSLPSLTGYLKAKSLFAHVFSRFTTIMAQTEEDKSRFLQIGVPNVQVSVTGNIKFDQSVPEIDDQWCTLFQSSLTPTLRAPLKKHPQILLAGSTHPGEEEMIASAFVRVKQRFPLLRLIVAPRDVNRASEVKALFNFRHADIDVQCLADDERVTHADVVIVDKMGILAGLYSACDIAFIGGSLLPFGGHNPLEPALFSKPVIFGPHMTDFIDPAGLLLDGGGAFQVSDENDITQILTSLLENQTKALQAGKKAGELLLSGKGAVDRVISIIDTAMSRN